MLKRLEGLAPRTATYKDVSTERDTGESLSSRRTEESTENQMNRGTQREREISLFAQQTILFFHFLIVFFFLRIFLIYCRR